MTFDGVRNVLRRPKGLIIGLFCQLLLMPLLCFAVAQALGLQPAIAIGIPLTCSYTSYLNFGNFCILHFWLCLTCMVIISELNITMFDFRKHFRETCTSLKS